MDPGFRKTKDRQLLPEMDGTGCCAYAEKAERPVRSGIGNSREIHDLLDLPVIQHLAQP